MASIRIKVGAAQDRSVDAVFSSVEKRAAASAQAVGKSFEKALSPKGRAGAAADEYAKPLIEGAKKVTEAISFEARKRILIEKTAMISQHRENLRMIEREAREKIGAQRRANAAAKREREQSGRDFAERTSHRATRFLLPNAPIGSMAMRGVNDIARGAGVDLSIGGTFSRVVEQEKMATALSNQGYQAGAEGPNGKRVDPRELIQQARGIGGQFGIKTTETLGALSDFAGITGDLDSGRKLLQELATLSAATGTNLADMASAAGNVYTSLGNIPNKAEAISHVMNVIAGQGKLGAVEIKDLATHMARVASAAGQFSGDASENIIKMGALAQIARAYGGAPSAAEATRSVGGFANTLKKGARIDAFKGAGIDVFADKGHTQFKDPLQLIKESLVATGGDLQKMNKLFMDVVGARTVTGLARKYSDAGGGQKGLEAVQAEFDRFIKKAIISEDEKAESARRAAETTAAKAERFNAQLENVVEKVATKLVPALEKAGPEILKFAELMGDAAVWAIENPGKAAAAAVSASILRAGLESTLRSGIERMLLGPTGPDGVPARAAKVGRVAAGVGSALVMASLAVSTLTVANMYLQHLIDENSQKRDADQKSREKKDAELVKLEKAAGNEGVTPEQAKQLREKSMDLAGRLGAAQSRQESSEFSNGVSDIYRSVLGYDGGATKVAQEQNDAASIGELKKQLDALNATIARGIKITNLNEIPQQPGGGAIPGRDALPVPGQ